MVTLNRLTDPPAAVQTAATEQSVIARARDAVNSCNWVIGECAAMWCERYAHGRGDEAFAEQVGVSRTRVNDCRLVWKRFAAHAAKSVLSWSHFRAALTWDDADECLAWAADNAASIREMEVWRRMNHGETLLGSDPVLPQSPAASTETGDTIASVADATAGLSGSAPPLTAPDRDPAETAVAPDRSDAGRLPRKRELHEAPDPGSQEERNAKRRAARSIIKAAAELTHYGCTLSAIKALLLEGITQQTELGEVEMPDNTTIDAVLAMAGSE